MARPHENLPLLAHLSSLNDLARLRTLRLLEQEELSVGELARALQLPQSTASRHLKLLHQTGWVAKRSEGTASLYRLAPQSLEAPMRELWALARAQLGATPTFEHDDARLKEVRAERRIDSKAFFGRVAGEWDSLRRELFGESFTSDALLSLVSPQWVVADLGCGTGDAAEHLASLVKKVIAVDREPAMLEAARKRLGAHRNVEFRAGELLALPLKNAEADAALVLLVLHHVEDPQTALKEIARILKPAGGGGGSGVALIVDMVKHDRASYRHTMGHVHLGFEEKQLRGWAKAAGFAEVSYRRLRPDTGSKGPALFAAMLRK